MKHEGWPRNDGLFWRLKLNLTSCAKLSGFATCIQGLSRLYLHDVYSFGPVSMSSPLEKAMCILCTITKHLLILVFTRKPKLEACYKNEVTGTKIYTTLLLFKFHALISLFPNVIFFESSPANSEQFNWTLTPAAASSTSQPLKSGAERWGMFLEKVSDKNWQVNKNRNIISSIINRYLGSCQNIPQCSGWFLSRRLRLSVKVLILRYWTTQSHRYAKCIWSQFFFQSVLLWLRFITYPVPSQPYMFML